MIDYENYISHIYNARLFLDIIDKSVIMGVMRVAPRVSHIDHAGCSYLSTLGNFHKIGPNSISSRPGSPSFLPKRNSWITSELTLGLVVK